VLVARATQQALVRLVALDLDGTLLRSDGSISERTRRTLSCAKASGLSLLFVTARPPRRARLVADGSDLSSVAICGNGSVVYDLITDTVLQEHRLRGDHAALLVESLRTAVPGVSFAVEVGSSYGCEPTYSIPHEHSRDRTDPLMRRAEALELCREGVTKLIVQQDDWPLPELWRMVSVFASSRATVTASGSSFIEVSAPGVSKAAALAAHCAARGVAREEVLAFGNTPNDLSMLRWAGRSIAVANAHPTVLAAADAVTRSNDSDGVAFALEHFGYA